MKGGWEMITILLKKFNHYFHNKMSAQSHCIDINK